jgi:hypothetical protein
MTSHPRRGNGKGRSDGGGDEFLNVALSELYWSADIMMINHVKEDEMDGTCNTHGREKDACTFLVRNPEWQ